MKFCSKCGNQLLDEAVMCPKCGSPVENAPLTEKQKQQSKDATSRAIKLLLAVGIVLAVILIAMAQYYH